VVRRGTTWRAAPTCYRKEIVLFRFALLLAGGGALLACGDPEATTDDDEVSSRRFSLVDPENPFTPEQTRTMQRALDKLARVAKTAVTERRRQLAAETLARIEAGDVLLGSVKGSRGIDRFHMCKDFKLPVCQVPAPAPDDREWIGDEALGRKLENELDGYQWGNRLYFTVKRSTDPDALAATLVHEVNHVAHRSECNYYVDIDEHVVDGTRAFIEEFRAYLSECYFVKDTSANLDTCTAYASKALEAYEFEHDLRNVVPAGEPRELTNAIVENGATALGHLVPARAQWPAAFGLCASR
jgi:hypothetical protein